MRVNLSQVEEAAKELYIRALKELPPDIKRGFDRLAATETDAGAKRMLDGLSSVALDHLSVHWPSAVSACNFRLNSLEA